MRRVNGIAFLTRVAISMGGATTTTSATQHRLVHAAMLSTCSNSNPLWFTQRLGDRFGLSKPSSVPRCAGGHMCFSANAAASAAQEVHPHVKSLPQDVVLYQYEACPFCNKVRAFLDYYNIPYKVMEVNPINKKEIEWSDYKMVPTLKVDGEQMVDSSDIIDKLHRRINPENTLNSEEEKKWRRLYERMVAKYAGAAATYFVSKKLKKRHNITDERAALYGAAETWVDALKGRQFLGGSNPNLADLAVFGVLRPIRHLKSGKDMVENTRIGEWYTRMESAVGEPARVGV
ncbi:prostaglandin E synthase 2-like isoform X2 [Pyrus x bretschneideri]|uniref:prostaglandin E synthase 2-like isoform X2 n=1 Tax=Pyrus x bretschneideri TaxID=225117 RepID=UPI00202E54EF|nr:prostaglandin E synthase 2-like isoform X2 [Pyrus x bretschneideri]